MSYSRITLCVVCVFFSLMSIATAKNNMPLTSPIADPEQGASATAGSTSLNEQGTTPLVSTAVLSGETLFKKNSASLSTDGQSALQKLIDDLDDFLEIVSIKIVGHTDSGGPAGFNQDLSVRRATYVKQFFSKAFPNVDIFALGVGAAAPIASNETAEGRNRNRRVEIQIVAKAVQP